MARTQTAIIDDYSKGSEAVRVICRFYHDPCGKFQKVSNLSSDSRFLKSFM